MSTSEALQLARHYQDVARRYPGESHFWTARSLFYGRKAVRPIMPRAARDSDG